MQNLFRQKYGVQIYAPTQAEMAEWKRLARSVWAQFSKLVSTDKLDQLRQLAGSK
jgi:hypothetical protein